MGDMNSIRDALLHARDEIQRHGGKPNHVYVNERLLAAVRGRFVGRHGWTFRRHSGRVERRLEGGGVVVVNRNGRVTPWMPEVT